MARRGDTGSEKDDRRPPGERDDSPESPSSSASFERAPGAYVELPELSIWPDHEELDALDDEGFDAHERGLVLLDERGVVRRYNQTESRMTGWRPSDALGLNFFAEVAPCTDVPEFRGRFRQAVQEGRVRLSFLYEFNFVTRPVRVAIWIVSSQTPDRFWLVTRIIEPLPKQVNHEAKRLLLADRLNLDLREMSAEQCASEQLEFSGHIQAEGALVVLDASAETVEAVSANLAEYLPSKADGVVGRPASEVLPPSVITRAKQLARASLHVPSRPEPVIFLGRDLRLVAQLHRWSGRILCELYADSNARAHSETSHKLAGWIASLHEANPSQLLEIACAALSEVSGMDRVLAYQFDEDNNGEVVAEVLTGELESLVGLRFPAGDIPPQARQLYVHNATRFCSNVDARPVPILSRRAAPVDLTYCKLRSFSPYHLQYQRNLGVFSFFSLSLRSRGRLRGLLIGHHTRPLRLTPWQRSCLSVLAATVEVCYAGHAERRFRTHREQASRAYGALLRSLATWQPPAAPDEQVLQSLQELFGAGGAALVVNGTIYCRPEITPGVVEQILDRTDSEPRPVYTSNVRQTWPELARQHPELGGVLVLSTNTPGVLSIVLWRSRYYADITWARGPGVTPGAVRRWVEARERVAPPWTDVELDFAEQLQLELDRALEPMWTARGFLDQTLQLDPSAILVVAEDETILEYNQTAMALLRARAGQLVARPIRSLVPAWRPEAEQLEETAVRTVSDDERFPARVRTHRVLALGNSRWTVYIQDLRPIHRLERQLREARHLESIGTLAAGLAHDFNNCLAVIQANADRLAQRDGLRESEPLSDILAASMSGQELASELLTFTRHDSASGERAADLCATVRGARRLLEVLVGDAIQIRWGQLDEPLIVPLRPSEIHQVLFNLVTNARDAIRGTGTITVAVRRDGLERALLQVVDTGVGMTAGVQRRIFEPFFTTKPRGVGTGLGLAQSLEIVQRAGGAVTLESEPGQGSSFLVSVPLLAVEDVKTTSEAPAEDAASGPPRARDDVTVLLVEDRDDLRKLYTALLGEFGYDAHAARSGEAALDMVASGLAPDIVFTDYSLEGMTGTELVRRLADREGLGFIVISGLLLDDELSDVPAPVEFLTKPVRMKTLEATIERLRRRLRSA